MEVRDIEEYWIVGIDIAEVWTKKEKRWIMKRKSKLMLYGYRSMIFFVLLLAGVCVINMLQEESWRLFF